MIWRLWGLIIVEVICFIETRMGIGVDSNLYQSLGVARHAWVDGSFRRSPKRSEYPSWIFSTPGLILYLLVPISYPLRSINSQVNSWYHPYCRRINSGFNSFYVPPTQCGTLLLFGSLQKELNPEIILFQGCHVPPILQQSSNFSLSHTNHLELDFLSKLVER